MKILLKRTILLAAILAVAGVSRLCRGADSVPHLPPPPPPEIATPASEEAKVPWAENSAAFRDPAFDRFVDLSLLAESYLAQNTEGMADAALQLLEGERVLMRPHRSVPAKIVIDATLRVATSQGDTATLDRLAKAVAKTGDAELATRIKAMKELASKPRAAAPAIALPENSPPELVEEMKTVLQRFQLAQSLADLEGLKSLEHDLKQSPNNKNGAIIALAKQVSGAVASASENGPNAGQAGALMRKLTASSRGVQWYGPRVQKSNDGSLYAGAHAYMESDDGQWVYFCDTKKAEPKRSVPGLKGVYGTAYVRTGEWMTATDGTQIWVYPQNPDYVYFAPPGGTAGWKGMKDTFSLSFQPSDLPKGTFPVIAAGAGNIQLAKVVATGGGNFTYAEVVATGGGNITIAQVVASGGGNLTLGPDVVRLMFKYPPKDTRALNVVATGGGNFTFAKVVASGGGNLRISTNYGVVGTAGGSLQERLAAVGGYVVSHDGGTIMASDSVRYLNASALPLSNYSLQSTQSVSGTPFRNAKVCR